MKIRMTRDIEGIMMTYIMVHYVTGLANMKLVKYVRDDYIGGVDVSPEYIEQFKQFAEKFGIVDKFMAGGKEWDISDIATLWGVIDNAVTDSAMSVDPGLYIFLLEHYTREMRLFSSSDVTDNPYVKNVKFDGAAAGDFEYRWQTYDRHELTVYDSAFHIGILNFVRLGMFVEKTRYPSIAQTSIKRTWMSVTPNEMFTMEKAIAQAHGKVLTLGLGMGYFAYMASLKNDVESIDIIEIDPAVIRLFEDYILPQFEFKSKIRIINADAVEYLRSYEDGRHDYCFADTWIGADDLEGYFKVKEASRKFTRTRFEYWIEDSFMSYLTDYLWLLIMQRSRMTSASFMTVGSDNLSARNMEYVTELYKHANITKPGDITKLMDPADMAKRVSRTKIIY